MSDDRPSALAVPVLRLRCRGGDGVSHPDRMGTLHGALPRGQGAFCGRDVGAAGADRRLPALESVGGCEPRAGGGAAQPVPLTLCRDCNFRPVFAHGDDAGRARGVADDHRPIAPRVCPHLHNLFGTAHTDGGARGAELLFQLGLHLRGGGAEHLGNGVCGQRRRGEHQDCDESDHGSFVTV